MIHKTMRDFCNRKTFRRAILAGMIAGFALLGMQEAQAIRVSMKRIVFEGPKRSDIITIMNNTAEEQTYRLGLRHYRMSEDRSLVNIDEDEAAVADMKWADDMIRYAPRRVTVPPGGSQQIRILLRRPRDLDPGEYRSHLWIVTESDTTDFAEQQTQNNKQSMQLRMMPAITMPIFVRHGEVGATAGIEGAKLSNVDATTKSLTFAITREGNRSLYGDLRIICTAGSEYVAREIRGIAVYPEVSRRIMDIDFTFPAEQASNCSRVRIEYVADKDDSQYSGQLMAQATAQ